MGPSKHITDAELVRQSVAGEEAAFDALVVRHRPQVLMAARQLVGDWETAEDVAQQALLEAFRGLPRLREPAKFRAWLLAITRRCAVRQQARQQPVSLEFSEAVIYPFFAPVAEPADNTFTERITASLAELSARDRQVMTLHYLDGYSCREIGQRLELPTGTVKRILHMSRNSLRTCMGDAVKGDGAMVRQQLPTGPRDLVQWVNGSWPGLLLRDSLSRSIYLTINKTPKTAEQIARAVDANSRYVRETLQPLLEEVLVIESAPGRYLDNYIALDADDFLTLTGELRPHGAEVADALYAHLPALEAAWNNTGQPERGFTWAASGIWPVTALMICNSGIFQHNPSQPPSPLHHSGHQYWLGCHEKVAEEDEPWSTWFNNNGPAGENLQYGFWWSPGLRRLGGFFPEARNRVLDAVSKGAADTAAVAAHTGESVERTREILAEAIELGLLVQHAGKLALTFPVISYADSETLFPTVDAMARQLVADILQPHTVGVTERLCSMGYGHAEAQFPVWRLWLEQVIAGEGLRALVERGILPTPGDPAPANFCMLGWYTSPNWPRVL